MHVRLKSITISDGTEIQLPAQGSLVFVGPNNSGKSRSLVDIQRFLQVPNPGVAAVVGLQMDKEATREELVAWLHAHCTSITDQMGFTYLSRLGTSLTEDAFIQHWFGFATLANISSMFVFYGGAESRLHAANQVPLPDFATNPPTAPLHYLYLDPDLERVLSDLHYQAFGIHLVVDRYNGGQVCLRVGEPPEANGTGAAPTTAYIKALHALPTMEEQGDGIRSFVGIALNLLAGDTPIRIIDEPEAFLHPPQAQRLGRFLSARADGQTVLATHSTDILQGLLAGDAPVTVVRLRREGDLNLASILDSQLVQTIWADPLLRYSKILDGLFNEAVVLCEADADCRFYESIADVTYGQAGAPRKPDALFTHCGGKHRMPTVVQALRAISVPVRVVADFDVLREGQLLHSILQSLGRPMTPEMEVHWRIVASSLESESKGLTTRYIRQEMPTVLDEFDVPVPTARQIEAARSLLKSETGWDRAKRAGKEAIPQGEASDACIKLLCELRAAGLYVVEVGELERFVPSVGGHGPEWVTAIHENRTHLDPNLTASARTFVMQVLESLSPT